MLSLVWWWVDVCGAAPEPPMCLSAATPEPCPCSPLHLARFVFTSEGTEGGAVLD